MSIVNSIKRCKPLLGTYVEVMLTAAEDDDTLLDMSETAFGQIQKIERLMSFHDPDSELSNLNRHAYEAPCAVSDELEEVLVMALRLSKLTQGLFDVSIAPELVKAGLLPDHANDSDKTSSYKDIVIADGKVSFGRKLLLDLGGIAKGYAVDKAYDAIESEVDNVVINAGGDLRMKQWRGQTIGVKTMENVRTIAVRNAAVATSASYYMRKGQNAIICPQTKQAIEDNRTISVFAPTAMVADALTKVAFLAPNCASVMKMFAAQSVYFDDNMLSCDVA